ncbi:MAG: N-acetyl sugar amidotransferase [Bdellovibrionota bacterium]
MKYCTRCVMPSTRPGLRLDESGLCAACKWHESKSSIDWDARIKDLNEIADWARKNSHAPWDCVVGVSGGKDSTWQAMYLRDELGLNPLLVQYSSSEGNDLGKRNLENLVDLGFSLISVHPSPLISQKLSKRSFIEHGNLCKYSETSLFSSPFRAAMAYEIPLVFFGENPALETGDSNLEKGKFWDATTIRHNNTLGGANLDIWLGDGISQKDLLPYIFPTEAEFSQWGGRGIFMGYYLNWSGYRNALYTIQNGLEPHTTEPRDLGNHQRHNALDWDEVVVNSMLKHIKLGFGHTTEFVCYDIRDGRVTREEAIALVKELDGKCHPRFIEQYCYWVGITVEKFWEVTETFYGSMWEKEKEGSWKLHSPIWEQEPPDPSINIDKIIERLNTKVLAEKMSPLPIYPPKDEDLNLLIKKAS